MRAHSTVSFSKRNMLHCAFSRAYGALCVYRGNYEWTSQISINTITHMFPSQSHVCVYEQCVVNTNLERPNKEGCKATLHSYPCRERFQCCFLCSQSSTRPPFEIKGTYYPHMIQIHPIGDILSGFYRASAGT